jgi:hypothetical protein
VVRYSFLARLFHPLLHAGLSRRSVNYFFYLTTIISPYQRQLLFDSLGGGAERPSSGEGAEPFWPAAPRLLRLSLSSAICKIVWAAKAGKADHHTFFFS